MPAQMFVNPLPHLNVSKILLFDFPCEYHAQGCSANVRIETPGVEELYGKLGTPLMAQGHSRVTGWAGQFYFIKRKERMPVPGTHRPLWPTTIKRVDK